MSRPTLARSIAPCLIFLVAGSLGFAQAPEETAAPASAPPEAAASDPQRIHDPYDTTAPVGALRAFIDAARSNDWATAAQRLNLEGASAEEGPELARWLKIVLDRSLWFDYARVSDRRSGDLDDGLPPDIESLGTIQGADVLLERMPPVDGERHWKFSASTVRRIPELWEAHGHGPLEEMLPRWMFDTHLLEMQAWQWAGLALLVLVVWLVSWLVVRVLHAVARPIVERSETDVDDRLLGVVDAPARLLVAIGLFAVGTLFLELSVRATDMVAAALTALSVVAVTWLALRTVDFLAELVKERLERTEQRTAVAIVPLGRRAVKVVLVALALIAVLQNVGFEVTGLVAGLGVGGLAFALAAQKTIENLFGGVSLVADQPVRVGDFCRFGDKVGIVEEIGLRSTRIRTLDRTRITVPNSQFSEIHLETFAARDRVRLLANIGLRYETSPDQLRFVLAGLRRVLIEHPMVDDAPVRRVRFIGFGTSSLDLEIFAYVRTTDYAEFLAVREDIFLRFMDAIAKAGTSVAFPSQTVYMARDGGLNAERTAEGERQVRDWREGGELPFPDYPAASLERLHGTGDWPPAGSFRATTDAGGGTDEGS